LVFGTCGLAASEEEDVDESGVVDELADEMVDDDLEDTDECLASGCGMVFGLCLLGFVVGDLCCGETFSCFVSVNRFVFLLLVGVCRCDVGVDGLVVLSFCFVVFDTFVESGFEGEKKEETGEGEDFVVLCFVRWSSCVCSSFVVGTVAWELVRLVRFVFGCFVRRSFGASGSSASPRMIGVC